MKKFIFVLVLAFFASLPTFAQYAYADRPSTLTLENVTLQVGAEKEVTFVGAGVAVAGIVTAVIANTGIERLPDGSLSCNPDYSYELKRFGISLATIGGVTATIAASRWIYFSVKKKNLELQVKGPNLALKF